MSALPPLTPWQQRAYATAADALVRGRLAHAMLFVGAEHLGKRIVAERLAQRLLCEDEAGIEPCGACRSCRLFAVRNQQDPVELRPDGQPAHPFGHAGHPDLRLLGHAWNNKARPPKLRGEIVIEQIREMSERLALTSQYGRGQVAILDPADAINRAAANALLKTLEEPGAGRYLWLITPQPAHLPATIRSRCQRMDFPLPPRTEAIHWLQSQGVDAAAAGRALDAAGGNPGLARRWLADAGLDLRRQVEADLEAVAGAREAPQQTAQRWVADGAAAQRLRHAAEVALTQARGGLTDSGRTRRLAAWFDAANRIRDLLRSPIRADLAVTGLLLQWREDHAPVSTRRPV